MNDNERIWQEACERVGVWKHERCRGNTFWFGGELKCDQCQWNRPLLLSQIQGTIPQEPHDVPCRYIGDPAAAMAMLEYYVREEGWYTLKDAMLELLAPHPYDAEHIRLAIAAAVVALPH